jgi:chromosome segregation ATPase
MKKISVFITAVLMMSFIIIPTNYVQAKSMDDIIKNVDNTNMEITKKIGTALEDVQDATDKYLKDLDGLVKGKEVAKIERELGKLQYDLYMTQSGTEKHAKILKDIDKATEKIQIEQEKYESEYLAKKTEIEELQSQINSLTIDSKDYKKTEEHLRKTLVKYNNVDDKNFEEVQSLGNKYIADIDKIICELLNKTNDMSAKMVNDAAKEGVTVYCEWVLVKFGNRYVLVDPLRIGNH